MVLLCFSRVKILHTAPLNLKNGVFPGWNKTFSDVYSCSFRASGKYEKTIGSRACERSGAGSEQGAARAKYSRSAERVFNQRPERSLCLTLVPLRYRSHHEPRACKNPPRMLRVDFPFRAYVNRLEQPHCLRNTRISGAVQPHRNLGPATE